MNLLVVLIVLGLRQMGMAVEPAATVSALMRGWRDRWLGRGEKEAWGGWLVLAFVVLLPTLVVAALVTLLAGVWHSLFVHVVSLLVLLVVLLDRRQPDVMQREREAWLRVDEEHRALLVQTDPATLAAAAATEFARVRRALLEEQLHELFAPLFWYLLLGPIAAIAYYFLRLAAEADDGAARKARELLHFADWPVARLLALSFALAGDFVATWGHWRGQVLNAGVEAGALLDESAAAAQPVDLTLSQGQTPGAVMSQGLQVIAALLQRALVIWIVLLALHTLWP